MAKKMNITRLKISPGAILLFIILMMTICLFILRINLAFSYLPEIGGVSINVMYGIMRILSGSELYTNPEAAPFPIIQYMPLHFYVVTFIGKLLGVTKDVHSMMVVNRVFCLILDASTVFVIGRTLVKTLQVKKNLAIALSCIYFLSIPSIIYARVDNLYLFFFVATLAVLLKNIFSNRAPHIINIRLVLLSGVLCMLALLTKQTAVFLFGFCCIYYIFLQRSMYQWTVFMGGAMATLLISLIFIYPDSLPYFKLNVLDGVKNGFNPNWFTEVILKNFFLKFSYILASGFFIALLLFKERSRPGYIFLSIGIAWFFTTATITAFKAGSGSNYYLEFIALSIYGAALLLKNQIGPTSQVVLFALMLSPFFIISAANDKGWGDLGMMKKAKKNYLNCIDVSNYLKSKIKDGEWILTDFHKENTLNLQLSDKALFPCREVALYFTRPIGIFHFKEFQILLEDGKIPYIITREGEELTEFIEVPIKNYERDTLIGKFQIFKKSN
ncbi:MAG: hypothetical protein IPO63_01925 [Bacteroidetes bacterium]|nr:hypothetical protein [Bacteroidota bacterium]